MKAPIAVAESRAALNASSPHCGEKEERGVATGEKVLVSWFTRAVTMRKDFSSRAAFIALTGSQLSN
jgi:hypothetical protein